jgi:hypothetical protein
MTRLDDEVAVAAERAQGRSLLDPVDPTRRRVLTDNLNLTLGGAGRGAKLKRPGRKPQGSPPGPRASTKA